MTEASAPGEILAVDGGLFAAARAETALTPRLHADLPVAALASGPSPVPLGLNEGLSLADAGGWLLASMTLFGLLLALDLWFRGRQREVGGHTGGRRVSVDTSNFVTAAGGLKVIEAMPRMRAVAPPRVVVPGLPSVHSGPMLTEFKLFRLNETGIVDLAETGAFQDADSALRRAAAFGQGAKVEVWQGRCRIAVISDTRTTRF